MRSTCGGSTGGFRSLPEAAVRPTVLDGGRAGPAVSPAAGPADNVAVDTPVEHAADQAWWQRAIAGLLALPLTAYSLMFAAALLRGRFDPLGAIFGSCAGTLAVLCWWFALRGHIAESRRRMRLALLGGLILGGIGFVAGFFGPILLSPGANQGPLLGIFVTGPLGFVAGAAAGWIYGRTRKDGAQESVPGRRAA